MILIALLVGLFVLFFVIRHHTGPAHLAMIAGLSVYNMFGASFADWTHKLLTSVPLEIIQAGVYLALILVFPLLLYLRSSRGGLSGILRILEAAAFAILLTALLSSTVAKFFTFDTIAIQISSFIASIEGPLVLVGILSAYFDIMMYRS
ncbi:hypothetical protein IKF94_02700 [Candidatus Saccharibacteria bacterium]|nr:hypothetical protein [Candidatus Saccharibacteria bacterium]